MTVADLIAELQKMPPHQPVKLVVVGGAYCMAEDCGVRECNAESDLKDVSFQGNHIRLEGD